MHEYSIAYDIYLAAKQAAVEHRAGKVSRIYVEMGELVMANPDQVHFLFDVIAEEDQLFRGTELVFTTVIPRARCPCGYEGEEVFSCPKCGNMPELLKGREIIVTRMEIEVDTE